jgi:hypothetical protein
MTSHSLREPFHPPEDKSTVALRIIAAATEAKVVKPDEKVEGTRKYARPLPFWARNLI